MSSVAPSIPIGSAEPVPLHPFLCFDHNRSLSDLNSAFFRPFLRRQRLGAIANSNTHLSFPPPTNHSDVDLNELLECLVETDYNRCSITLHAPGLHTPIPNHSASVPFPVVVFGSFSNPGLFFATAGLIARNGVFHLGYEGPKVGFLRQCGLGRDFVIYLVARVDNFQEVRVVVPLVIARPTLSLLSRLRLLFPCRLRSMRDLKPPLQVKVETRKVVTDVFLVEEESIGSFGGGEDIGMTSISSYAVDSSSSSMRSTVDEVIAIHGL